MNERYTVLQTSLFGTKKALGPNHRINPKRNNNSTSNLYKKVGEDDSNAAVKSDTNIELLLEVQSANEEIENLDESQSSI